MVFQDPLDAGSTTPDGRPIGGTSPWLMLLWFVCIPLGIYGFVDQTTDHSPNVAYPGDEQLTPELIASYRALPPERQLDEIFVEPYATDAMISCRTLEPLKIQLRYTSSGSSEKTTTFPEPRPQLIHIHDIEGLKPDTEYRFQITSLELDSGIPRVTRTGHFHTLLTDGPPATPSPTHPPSPFPPPYPSPPYPSPYPSPGASPASAPASPRPQPKDDDDGPDADEPASPAAASPAQSSR